MLGKGKEDLWEFKASPIDIVSSRHSDIERPCLRRSEARLGGACL